MYQMVETPADLVVTYLRTDESPSTLTPQILNGAGTTRARPTTFRHIGIAAFDVTQRVPRVNDTRVGMLGDSPWLVSIPTMNEGGWFRWTNCLIK